MSRRRVVLPAGSLGPFEGREPGARLSLPASVVAHLRVLRLTDGVELEVTDGEGRVATGALRVQGRRLEVDLGPVTRAPTPRPPEIRLLQGVGKGEKLDQVVRQVAELGATAVHPVLTERAVARREHKLERLRGIADDALRVSGRAHRMAVTAPAPLDAALEAVDRPGTLRVVLDGRGAEPLASALAGEVPSAVALLVGPEGGLSPEERARALERGFRSAHLGPHTLRTETAGPAVVAMVRFRYGLGPGPSSG